jgi:hypothetical protein
VNCLRSSTRHADHPCAAAIATSVPLYRSDARVCTLVKALWGDTDAVGPKLQMPRRAQRK